jgi:hypothetical protein
MNLSYYKGGNKMSIVNVATAAELKAALANVGEEALDIVVTNSIDVTSGEITGFNVTGGVVTITLNEGVEIKGVKGVFNQTGGSLTFKGTGSIATTTSNANAAIYTANTGTVLNIDGITIDVTKYATTSPNWCYGIYAKNGAEVNVNSGTIKTDGCSAISTNNTTGGATFNVTGGNLLSESGYAIYFPAQGIINISGGTVQGIQMRMGKLYISGDAQIIATGINAENCDDIGANTTASGCLAIGDTICVLSGTYSDPHGTDTEITITGDATVAGSDFKPAIGAYLLDTKQADTLTIEVAHPENITNPAPGTQTIKVYGHDEIAEAAAAAGKPFNPVAEETEVEIEEIEDPDTEDEYSANECKEIADEYNSHVVPKEEAVDAIVSAVTNRAKVAASKGLYSCQVMYQSYSIPWKLEYKADVIAELRVLGYQVKEVYSDNDITQAIGILVKWG